MWRVNSAENKRNGTATGQCARKKRIFRLGSFDVRVRQVMIYNNVGNRPIAHANGTDVFDRTISCFSFYFACFFLFLILLLWYSLLRSASFHLFYYFRKYTQYLCLFISKFINENNNNKKMSISRVCLCSVLGDEECSVRYVRD